MTRRRLFGWAVVAACAVNVGLHLPALESHPLHLCVLGALCFAAVLAAVAGLSRNRNVGE